MTQPALHFNQLVYARLNKVLLTLKEKEWDSTTNIKVEIGPLHDEFISLEEAKKERFVEIKPYEVFASQKKGEHGEFPWGQRWFKITIPKAKKNELGKRYLQFICHGEQTVYIDDQPWGGVDCCHPEVVLPNKVTTLYLDGGLWQTGIWGGLEPPDEEGFVFKNAKLCIRNEDVWEAYHDLKVLSEIIEYYFKKHGTDSSAQGFGFNEPLGNITPFVRKLVRRLDDVCDVFETKGVQAFVRELKKVYKDFKSDPNSIAVNYIGHAHIDLVWLWPERVTYKKGVHTFSTVLRLMDKYPEFKFTMSQPPLYYQMQKAEPAQARQVVKRIKEGRWEFTGGLEVEADTQIPVGEGLARSLVYGQQRIEAVRGERSKMVWIPDVFGYSQCLPQIFKLGEIDYFYTTKMTWSALNKFPHNSFSWSSPDGSKVLTHLSLVGYNSDVKVEESIDSSEGYQQSDIHDELLIPAGYGDGGGGPTEEHCERVRRLSDLSGVPNSEWKTAEDFFDDLSVVEEKLPRYRGELYLEYHRGVQTTQSDLKYYLRKAERALQVREALRVIQGKGSLGKDAWLRYLFAHFHDAIPGSSINTVYKEMNPELSSIAESNFELSKKEWAKSKKKNTIVVNPLALKTNTLIELESYENGSFLIDDTGKEYVIQKTGSGRYQKAYTQIELDGLESKELSWTKKSVKKSVLQKGSANALRLKNDRVQASFTKSGELKQLLIDGEQIQLDGVGKFMLHSDFPAIFDAWDIDHQATWLKEKACKPMSLKIKEDGPLMTSITGSSPVGEKSQLTVEYKIEKNSPYLHMDVIVDWHEEHKLLRYEVPTDYKGEQARYGAPFGSVDRSQKEGLPSDEAQWEVPGSRWASVIDGKGKGLSVITEAKYGFSIKDGVIGLSLLRSPKHPDPVADMGKHHMKFTLGLHSDETTEENFSTAAAADALYTKPIQINGGVKTNAPFTLNSLGSVVPSWVLPSETTQGYVIRFHEVAGGAQSFEIQFNHNVKSIQEVNLFENEVQHGCKIVKKAKGIYEVEIKAYKIVSLLIK